MDDRFLPARGVYGFQQNWQLLWPYHFMQLPELGRVSQVSLYVMTTCAHLLSQINAHSVCQSHVTLSAAAVAMVRLTLLLHIVRDTMQDTQKPKGHSLAATGSGKAWKCNRHRRQSGQLSGPAGLPSLPICKTIRTQMKAADSMPVRQCRTQHVQESGVSLSTLQTCGVNLTASARHQRKCRPCLTTSIQAAS